jgi:predicted metalloprotease
MRMPGGAIGGGAGLLIAIIASLVFGIDPRVILNGGGGQAVQQPYTPTAEDEQAKQFVEVVLGDTEKAWTDILAEQGIQYPKPTLVLFSGAVDSACGMAQAAVGPFYCPNDKQVYLDLSFFNELSQRFGAPGDFAQAYVVAHEVGHHVQDVLGLLGSAHDAQGRASQDDANRIQVRVELQADCLAGVWGHFAREEQGFIEFGDIEEGLAAASAIGDDRLQREAQGYVVPESFTHGSSEQRVRWFRRGLEGGTIDACDTFAGDA